MLCLNCGVAQPTRPVQITPPWPVSHHFAGGASNHQLVGSPIWAHPTLRDREHARRYRQRDYPGGAYPRLCWHIPDFLDYMRPAVRLAALMGVPAIYV